MLAIREQLDCDHVAIAFNCNMYCNMHHVFHHCVKNSDNKEPNEHVEVDNFFAWLVVWMVGFKHPIITEWAKLAMKSRAQRVVTE